MAINLNNFVNINIKYHISSDATPTREIATLILFNSEAYSEVNLVEVVSGYYILKKSKYVEVTKVDVTDEDTVYYTNKTGTVATSLTLAKTYYADNEGTTEVTSISLTAGKITTATYYNKNENLTNEVYSSLSEISNESEEYKYAEYFFKNSGKKLRVIKTLDEDTETNYIDILKTLDYQDIVVMSNAKFDVSVEVAKKYSYIKETTEISEDGVSAINQKIILAEVTDVDDYIQNYEDECKDIQFLVLKYSKSDKSGIEATIAAYLTQINIDNMDSVKDYAFTKEELLTNDESVVDDDSMIKNIIKYNLNADAWLLSVIRNIGGNDTAGKDLVNQFMLICLHQTLTEQLVELLTTKVKYNNSGLTLISSVINDELQRYVNNGYLSTNKSWTENDLVYQGYTVIKKNTPLSLGYKYIILPFSTLSPEERKNHKLPNIYILISDNYSIRKIEIVGEVF